MTPITTHPRQHFFYFLFLLFYNYLFGEERSTSAQLSWVFFWRLRILNIFFYLFLLAICNYFFEKYLLNSLFVYRWEDLVLNHWVFSSYFRHWSLPGIDMANNYSLFCILSSCFLCCIETLLFYAFPVVNLPIMFWSVWISVIGVGFLI